MDTFMPDDEIETPSDPSETPPVDPTAPASDPDAPPRAVPPTLKDLGFGVSVTDPHHDNV
jgi:hypothetical protein